MCPDGRLLCLQWAAIDGSGALRRPPTSPCAAVCPPLGSTGGVSSPIAQVPPRNGLASNRSQLWRLAGLVNWSMVTGQVNQSMSGLTSRRPGPAGAATPRRPLLKTNMKALEPHSLVRMVIVTDCANRPFDVCIQLSGQPALMLIVSGNGSGLFSNPPRLTSGG